MTPPLLAAKWPGPGSHYPEKALKSYDFRAFFRVTSCYPPYRIRDVLSGITRGQLTEKRQALRPIFFIRAASSRKR